MQLMKKIDTEIKNLLIVLIGLFCTMGLPSQIYGQDTEMKGHKKMQATEHLEKATLGAGCFWCTEAVFEQLKGVKNVVSGFAGGRLKDIPASVRAKGLAGDVEIVRITFDLTIISYKQLLTVFWHLHDPTTPNRQGLDIGPQYRSVIFYHNQEQKKIAEKSLKEVKKTGLWDDPIVTTVEPLKNYVEAKEFHQDYYEKNPDARYCKVVIAPKLEKLKKEFGNFLKKN